MLGKLGAIKSALINKGMFSEAFIVNKAIYLLRNASITPLDLSKESTYSEGKFTEKFKKTKPGEDKPEVVRTKTEKFTSPKSRATTENIPRKVRDWISNNIKQLQPEVAEAVNGAFYLGKFVEELTKQLKAATEQKGHKFKPLDIDKVFFMSYSPDEISNDILDSLDKACELYDNLIDCLKDAVDDAQKELSDIKDDPKKSQKVIADLKETLYEAITEWSQASGGAPWRATPLAEKINTLKDHIRSAAPLHYNFDAARLDPSLPQEIRAKYEKTLQQAKLFLKELLLALRNEQEDIMTAFGRAAFIEPLPLSEEKHTREVAKETSELLKDKKHYTLPMAPPEIGDAPTAQQATASYLGKRFKRMS